MEVHHHPDLHKKKNFKEYFFEILMIFLAELGKEDSDPDSFILGIVNRYREGNKTIPGNILNAASFDRSYAANMILFYKQMVVSTRTLQLKQYVVTNQKILEELRLLYKL